MFADANAPLTKALNWSRDAFSMVSAPEPQPAAIGSASEGETNSVFTGTGVPEDAVADTVGSSSTSLFHFLLGSDDDGPGAAGCASWGDTGDSGRLREVSPNTITVGRVSDVAGINVGADDLDQELPV